MASSTIASEILLIEYSGNALWARHMDAMLFLQQTNSWEFLIINATIIIITKVLLMHLKEKLKCLNQKSDSLANKNKKDEKNHWLIETTKILADEMCSHFHMEKYEQIINIINIILSFSTDVSDIIKIKYYETPRRSKGIYCQGYYFIKERALGRSINW